MFVFSPPRNVSESVVGTSTEMHGELVQEKHPNTSMLYCCVLLGTFECSARIVPSRDRSMTNTDPSGVISPIDPILMSATPLELEVKSSWPPSQCRYTGLLLDPLTTPLGVLL